MRTTALRPIILLLALSICASAEDAMETARAMFASASAAYQAAADARDQAGQDGAAEQLREALGLFNRHLEAHPEDLSKCEGTLTEINAILFWHGRMRAPDTWEDGDSPTDESAREAEKARREQELVEAREQEAQRMFDAAMEYGQNNPDDLYGRRIELREVLIQFPDATAADLAKVEIERVDELITAREAAVDVASEASGGKPPTPEEVEDAEALAIDSAAVPLLHLMRMRLDKMQGSETERFVLGQIRDLFAKRRFIEAQQASRDALAGAVAPGDQGRIDRIVLGLSRGVTIMDQAVGRIGDRIGEEETLLLIGGGSFAGRLESLTWNAIVVRTPEATVHVPYFRLSDETLVRLAAARKTAEASLAAGAFLALSGDGAEAISHLKAAEKLGAATEEVETLRHLAGDEKAKRQLEAEIKKESRRWRAIVSLEKKLLKAYAKTDYMGFLKAILKGDRRSSFTDRDLAWLSERARKAVSQPLDIVIRNARESCKQQHQDENRVLTCPKCNGAGTILTRSPGGLFGVKKRSPVRVRCPTCKGKKQIACPECYDRYHDKDARELQKRAGLSGRQSEPGKEAEPHIDRERGH